MSTRTGTAGDPVTIYDPPVPRHFLTGEELTADELGALVDRALELKRTRAALFSSAGRGPLAGRSVAMVFEKPSTRTRVSFEVAVHELGGHPVVLREGEMQLARGESPRDTARVLSRLVHAIAIRTGPHAIATDLADHADVPVVNLLTSEHHPCQALADLMTLRERFGRLEGLKLVYVGDGNNVTNSLMILGARAGLEVVAATPAEHAPSELIATRAGDGAAGSVTLMTDPELAAEDAHALYADVWLSMADRSDERAQKRASLAPYRLDSALLARARDDAIALHCLPAHPDEEISWDVLYGDRAAVWDQAENRLHAQKALLEFLLDERRLSEEDAAP